MNFYSKKYFLLTVCILISKSLLFAAGSEESQITNWAIDLSNELNNVLGRQIPYSKKEKEINSEIDKFKLIVKELQELPKKIDNFAHEIDDLKDLADSIDKPRERAETYINNNKEKIDKKYIAELMYLFDLRNNSAKSLVQRLLSLRENATKDLENIKLDFKKVCTH